jgi:hypothetical protein
VNQNSRVASSAPNHRLVDALEHEAGDLTSGPMSSGDRAGQRLAQ